MIRNGTTLPGRSPAHQEVVGALDQACAIWGARWRRWSLAVHSTLSPVRPPVISRWGSAGALRERGARINAALPRNGGTALGRRRLRNRATDAPGFHGIEVGLSTRDGGVPTAADPACVAAGGGIKAAICAACWPRQNAFESSGLVLRNPILLLSILAISGIACSGTSPASTPAATDFNRASCPALKSRCLFGLRCRTSGSPQPHRQTGFWNQPTSVTTWDLRRAQARLIDSLRVSDFVMLFCSFAIRKILPVSEPRQIIEIQGDYYANARDLRPVCPKSFAPLGLLTGWVSLRFGGPGSTALAIRLSLCLNIQMQRYSGMLFLAVFTAALSAQAPTGEIAGTVYDASGGVVPNASIKVKNAATAFERALLSNQSGQFSVPSLGAGAYEMRVEAPGFRSYSVKAVVATGGVTTVDPRLQLGEQKDTVTVETINPQLQVESHAIDQLIPRQQIKQLPLNGRGFLQLAFLSPGVAISSKIGRA